MTRVFLLAEHSENREYFGGAFIRLIQPFLHPSLSGRMDVRHGFDLPNEKFDVVILERFLRSNMTLAQAKDLLGVIRGRARKFVYEIDDNLLDLFWDEPWHPALNEDQRAMVRFFLREADAVMVSTQPLAERLDKLAKRTFLVPNAIDETIFPPMDATLEAVARRVNSARPVTFGYMGTHTHTEDLMMILEPIRKLLRKYDGRVVFQVAQATKDPRVRAALEGLPFTTLDVGTSHYYPLFVKYEAEHFDWDFGIAPLTDSPLNRGKSDLKFIEYGVLGIPGIFSSSPSFSGTVKHMHNGILCPEDPAAWFDAFELMVNDATLRHKLAVNVLRYVHKKRTLVHCAPVWFNVVDSVLKN